MVDVSGTDLTNDRANLVSLTEIKLVVIYSSVLPRLAIARGDYRYSRKTVLRIGLQKPDKMGAHKSSSAGDENAPHSILIATDPVLQQQVFKTA
jgi:hypothetical protein